MYLEIKSDNTRKTHGRKPNWFNSDGAQLSDTELIERENTYPVQDEEVTDDYDRLQAKPVDDWVVKDTYVEKTFYRVFDNRPDYDPLYQEIRRKDRSEGTQDGDKLYIEGNVTDLSVKETKQKMSEELPDLRWRYETGGLKIGFDGEEVKVHTDRESQSKILGAFVSASQGLMENGRKWKTMDDFKLLSSSQIVDLGAATNLFVQECYDNEDRISNLINNCSSISDCQNVYYNEFNSGWPENAVYEGE